MRPQCAALRGANTIGRASDMVVINRIAEHVGTEQGAGTGISPPLVALRNSVQGKCDFHIVRVRRGVYQVRLGRSADAVVSFRHWPDHIEDSGQGKAWRKLRAALKREGETGRFTLESLDCSVDANNLAERVGSMINGWRLATGRADFPSAAFVAQAVELPEMMVKVALRDYRTTATRV